MTDMDRIKKGLSAFVKAQFPKIDYLGQYPAKVVKQNEDLTLEVMVDDPRMPPLSGIVLRTFAPGITIKVEPEARVLVMFENGDPSKPVASLFNASAGSLAELGITAASVQLGADPASDALLLGTTYREADASFDASVTSAMTALATACTTAGTALAGFLDPNYPPSDGGAAGIATAKILSTLATAISSAASTLQTAATAKEGGSATGDANLYLSTISKTS